VAQPEDLSRLVAPFLENPDRAGIVCDFDGTLAEIVPDPQSAEALPGVADALRALARRYARVAVVSGRPAAFLVEQLDLRQGAGGLIVAGLYGLERVVDGEVEDHPDAAPWREVVDEVAARAEHDAPEGVGVEHKGLSVTLHFRQAPEHAEWAESWGRDQAERSGLALHPGRQSFELRPPLEVDKGTAVAELLEGMEAACFLGDDVGDLPAFDALDRLASTGVTTLRVGVASSEAPEDLVERADAVVEGPSGALEVLRRLLD
jgi:trehalose 6-phosphate phosphatase